MSTSPTSTTQPPEKGKVSISTLKKQDEKVLEGDAAARRSLNALSITSDFVSALIQHPGAHGDHESMVVAARAMILSADHTTQQLVDDIGLKKIPWAKYRIMKMVSGAVADRWAASSRLSSDHEASADVSHLLPVWLEIARHDLPDLTFDEPADSNRVALQVALLDAMQPVMQQISIFDMFHDPLKAAMHVRDLITSMAQSSVDELVGKDASQRSRNQLLQSLLRNAGTIYAAAWRRHAEDTVEDLKQMTKDQQTLILEMNADGLPLKTIDDSFIDSYTKLVEMAQYLSGPKPPLEAEITPASVSAAEYFGPDTEDISSSSVPSTFDNDLDSREARVQSTA